MQGNGQGLRFSLYFISEMKISACYSGCHHKSLDLVILNVNYRDLFGPSNVTSHPVNDVLH